MSRSNLVHLDDVEILRLTLDAAHVKYDGQTYWLPRSQIDDAGRLKVGTGWTLSITEWIAEKKGIEGSED